jgi:predicted RNase H-like nuclease (RuvC/YqgF family)
MEVFYDTVNAHYCLNLCGVRKHRVELGADALGNLTRIENELAKLPARLEAAKTKKAETIAQLETAKLEVEKPFAFEDELREKTERLNALNIELNLDEKDTSVVDAEPELTREKCAALIRIMELENQRTDTKSNPFTSVAAKTEWEI